MKGLNIFSSLVIVSCAIFLSVNHTHNLYVGVGFSNVHAWVATVMIEVMFVTGGINISVAQFRNYKPSGPAKTGFYFGLAIVGWSNIASTADFGLPGYVLGGSIVAVVIIMEMIMISQVGKTGEPVENEPDDLETLEESPSEEPDHPEGLEAAEEPAEILETTPENGEPAEETTPESVETPEEWARYLWGENGRKPTRAEVMEAAGCKEWAARKALNTIKGEFENV